MPKVVYKIPAQEIEIDVDPEMVQQWHGMGIPQRTEAVEDLLWQESHRFRWDYEFRS